MSENPVKPIAAEVGRYWASQGLRVLDYQPARVPLFLRGKLPRDYEAFLAEAGLPEDEDKHGFLFWHPSLTACEVRAVGGRDGRGGRVLVPDGEDLLIFADYLQESWWYGLWLAGRHEGSVSLVLGTADDPQPPLGTFIDFLSAYLVQGDALFPRGPQAASAHGS